MNLGTLDEETTKLFKDYLKQTVRPLTTANPDLLSDYAYTILRKDKIEDATKPKVIEKLKDFLKNEAESFVNQIFQVLVLLDDKEAFTAKLRQILGLPPKQAESVTQSVPKDDNKPVHNHDATEAVEVVVDVDTQEKPNSPKRSRSRSRSRSPNRSRSRSRSDEERAPKRRRIETPEDSRPMRGGDRGRGGRGRGRGRGGYMGQDYRKPCRDFNELGYCLRGESCPYSHGTNVVAINDLDKLQQYNVPMPMGGPVPPVPMPADVMMGHAVPVFDPDMNPPMPQNMRPARPQHHDQNNGDSYMVPISRPYNNNNSGTTNSHKRKYSERDNAGGTFNQTMRENNDENSPEEGEGRGRFEHGRGGKSIRGGRDKPRGAFQQGGHQQGPHQKGANRDNTTLDIIHIPVEYMNEEKLREHFAKFGSITNITLIGKNKAQIQYSNHFEAKSAVKSPEAVFGNRFINVYWARDQPKTEGQEKSEGEPHERHERPEAKPHVPVDPAMMKLVSEEAEKKEKDKQEAMKQLKEKQQELKDQRLTYIKKQQKMLDDLLQMSKREGLSKPELEQLFGQITTVKTLLKTALEEQQKAVTASPQKPKQPLTMASAPFVPRRLPMHTEPAERPIKTEPVPESSETTSDASMSAPTAAAAPSGTEGESVEALRARLATLKQELKTMGGDPNLAGPVKRPPFAGTRRVRGRGGRVPRGGPAPYGFSQPPRTMKLDNRTTQFKLQNLPEGLTDQQKLTEHFKHFGGVVSVEVNGNEATVKMDNRRNAEMAISKGSTIDNNKVTASWYDPNARPSGSSAGKTEEETNVYDSEGPVVEEIIAGEDHDYSYDNIDA